MLKVEHIDFLRGQRQILQDISFDVCGGELMALLGPNGAGKSTLLKIMSGELQANSGEVFVNHEKLSDWDLLELAKSRAVMPQKSALNFDFTVIDVVLMGRSPFNQGWDRAEDLEIALSCLSEVECLHLKNRSFLTLSGGEQQRVSFARVLAQLNSENPQKNLLLDEPVSSLDPEHQLKTLELARQKADEGIAVFVILHDLNMAATFADKVAFLYEGQLKAWDSPEKVLTQAIIREVFNIDVDVQKHDQNDKILITNARVAG
ncbi:MAG: heme ABC transporter ATP-binding protein [Lentisphaeraceae bacterium]|nr:heme ABC transporter ATP-binding protein [Lentisphaeraceae bacterium]